LKQEPIIINNYIDGVFQNSAQGLTMPLINPATASSYGTMPLSRVEDVDLAYMAAYKAFPGWSSLSAAQRSTILLCIAEGIESRAEELSLAECIDNGKPLTLAQKVDIPRAATNMRFFAQAITQFANESYNEPEYINYTLRQPIGVVGCISPWNLPLYLFTWKIAPALATGNTVVAKPSETTPYTAYLFSEICMAAGLPAGVLNVLHGTGAECGNAIVSHPGIKAISFTGGTATGKHISSIAAPMFKKLSLELGGKNPNIIFDDCEYETMLHTTLQSSFSNQGQICLCGSRIYVQRGIYEKFKKDFVAKATALKVGNPLSQDTKVGAIVSLEHYNKILSYIKLAKQEGGHILCGGHAVHPEGEYSNGYFIAPTVIEGLSNSCRTNQEEIFGPVVTLTPFDTEQEVMALANDSIYGLSATIWTQQLDRAHRMAKLIEAGIVWINCWLHRDLRTPFGGMKSSGVGREGGLEALRFFTEPKNVCIKID